MSAFDGRLTDSVMDPVGNEAWSVEPLIRLPHFACFAPPAKIQESSPPPCIKNGYVTFGSLNNSQKISEETLFTWGKILHAVPRSKLLVIGPHASTSGKSLTEHIKKRLGKTNIPEEQTEILPQQSLEDFLALGERIDIALEPFPLTGAVTTAQALWMGLPCINYAGDASYERAAAAIVAAAGFSEFTSTDKEEYIRKSIQFSSDTSLITKNRNKLKNHQSNTKHINQTEFTKNLEYTLIELAKNNANRHNWQ